MVAVLEEKIQKQKISHSSSIWDNMAHVISHNYHMFSKGDIVSLAAARLDSYDCDF